MKGWQTKIIGDVCTVVNGGTPKTGVPAYWDGSHQWLTPAEMGKRSSPYMGNTARTVTDEGLQNSSARLLPPYSVILSSRAPIGYLVINTEKMATNQGCKGLIPNGDIQHKFLFYYLTSIVDLLNDLGTGATFKELSGGKLKDVPIPVPPLPEQQRIVTLLDEAFDGIATAKANAERNLQNARGLFESHLDAVLSRNGAGYTATTLGAEVDLLPGYAFPSGGYTDAIDAVRLLRGDNIMQGYFRWEEAKGWPSDDCSAYSRFALQDGDVVIAMDRPWVKAGLKRAQICADDLPSLLVQRTSRLRTLGKMRMDFLSHLTGSQSFSRHLLEVQTGIGVPHISGKQIESFKFMLPPMPDQESIADTLNDLLSNTQRLEEIYEEKLTALDELKKSLLHLAFSGKL